jgi:hypothetical protein
LTQRAVVEAQGPSAIFRLVFRGFDMREITSAEIQAVTGGAAFDAEFVMGLAGIAAGVAVAGVMATVFPAAVVGGIAVGAAVSVAILTGYTASGGSFGMNDGNRNVIVRIYAADGSFVGQPERVGVVEVGEMQIVGD